MIVLSCQPLTVLSATPLTPPWKDLPFPSGSSQDFMVAGRSDIAHPETDVAGQALCDFKMIVEYGRRIGVRLDSQAATPRLGARQRCDSGHDLQGERHIGGNLRSSRNGRNV